MTALGVDMFAAVCTHLVGCLALVLLDLQRVVLGGCIAVKCRRLMRPQAMVCSSEAGVLLQLP